MADTGKIYSEAEYNALADQLAQLKSGILGQQLLQFQQQQQQTQPGQLTIPPQGFATVPGAGTYGPQGVMFAGGSPWPVHTKATHIYNTLYGLNQALGFLKNSGILQRLVQQHAAQQMAQQQAAMPATVPTAPAPDSNATDNLQNW